MLFGQCPHGGGDKLKGASLTDVRLLHKVALLLFLVSSSDLTCGNLDHFSLHVRTECKVAFSPTLQNLLC